MKKTKRILKGLSLRYDPLFIRNLTLMASVVLIWRGIEHLLDIYFFPNNEILSSVLTIIIGIVLLFIFDSEIESDPKDGKSFLNNIK